MENEFTITGRIDANGNPLFAGIEQWNEFFSRFPNKTFICEVMILEPYTDDQMIWFYIKTILPRIQERFVEMGEIKNLKEIDIFFREEFPLFQKKGKNELKQLFDFERWEPIHECTYKELVLYIEYINKFTAEYLNLLVWQSK